jgi:hypothetical protein
MANTYTFLLLHIIFSTKDRKPLPESCHRTCMHTSAGVSALPTASHSASAG